MGNFNPFSGGLPTVQAPQGTKRVATVRVFPERPRGWLYDLRLLEDDQSAFYTAVLEFDTRESLQRDVEERVDSITGHDCQFIEFKKFTPGALHVALLNSEQRHKYDNTWTFHAAEMVCRKR